MKRVCGFSFVVLIFLAVNSGMALSGWVAAYGMAPAISLSRISSSAHFPSDVFLGSVLGYAITRYQVLRTR